MLKKAVQQGGRSERGGEAYASVRLKPLRDTRTPLEDSFSILLGPPPVALRELHSYVERKLVHQ
jgi:hypothetical protein